MGNYISCTLAGPVGGKGSSRGTKVIFPCGEIRRLQEPTKAAELMLEEPSHFLVNTRSLQIGRRFAALSADEELEMNSVYVFFPMRRLNSVATVADRGALFMAANSASKIFSIGGVRFSLESGGDVKIVQSDEKSPSAPPAKLNLDELASPEFKRRLSMCRSRKPLLETIVEEPVRLR